jgi:hypothetical protein
MRRGPATCHGDHWGLTAKTFTLAAKRTDRLIRALRR